jgi:hypothetical protein
VFDSLTPSHSRFVQRRGRLALTQVTLVRVQHREPFFTRVSFNRKGQNATNVQTGVRILIPVPPARRSMGQGISLQRIRSEFESQRAGHAVVAERNRHLIVDQDQEGSTPSHRAKLFEA